MDLVFLDANVLFSAAYRPDAGLRKLWRLEGVVLVTSGYAAEEARRNIMAHKPTQKDDLEKLLSEMKVEAVPPDFTPLSVSLREKDRPILQAAIHLKAVFLLTGDLKDFGPYFGQTIQGVTILRPAEYLQRKQNQMTPDQESNDKRHNNDPS